MLTWRWTQPSRQASDLDAAGNPGTAVATQAYAVDTANPALEIAVSVATADNAINAAEADVDIAVTGAVRGDFSAGDVVTLVINGKSFTGTLDANGNYSIPVPGADLAADTKVEASVASVDKAGNSTTASATQAYRVDTTAPDLQIAIATVTADNVLNAVEAAAPVSVTGTLSGDFQAGDVVVLNVGGNSYSGPADAAGHYSIAVPGSVLAGSATVSAMINSIDGAGNTATASIAQPYTVDTLAPDVTFALNPVSVDNVLNSEEVAGSVTISGQVGGDFTANDEVTLRIGGKVFTTAVDANGAFSVPVPGSALVDGLATGVQAQLASKDAAGNAATSDASLSYSIDTDAPAVALTLNAIPAGAASTGMPYPVTGQVTGDFAEGDVVSVVINGTSYTGPVDAQGRFSIEVPGEALAADADVQAIVDAVDAAGNRTTVSANESYIADTDADNDGIPDAVEGDGDSDGDGIPNRLDLDSDNDGLSDALEAGANPLKLQDTDGDGVPDVFDLDSDNDGISDLVETQGVTADRDNDGKVDDMQDANADGLDDALALLPVVPENTDGDALPNYLDTDTDNDGLPDVVEAGFVDADNDGVVDTMRDSDNDGIADSVDWDIQGGNDSDGDGIIDEADIDNVPSAVDTDGDGIIDARDPDANGDGRADLFADPGTVVLPDADNNGTADVLESRSPTIAAASPDGLVHTGLQGGGCSIVPGAGRRNDPLFALLIALAGLSLLRRVRVRRAAMVAGVATAVAAGSAMAAEPRQADAGLADTDAGSVKDVAYRDGSTEHDADFRRRIYAGIGLGRSWLEPDTSEVAGLDPNDRVQLGGQVMIGYDFSKLLSFELHAADLGDAGLNNGDSIAYRQGGASALFYVGRNSQRMQRVGLTGFGRAGVGYLGNKRDGNIAYAKDNAAHLLLGLGVEYAHRSGLALRGESILFDADANYTQLSLLYRFGRRNDEQAVLIADAIAEEPQVVTPVAAVAVARPSADEDADGVGNRTDECAATPRGLAVDAVGCALLRGVIQGVNFRTGSAELTDYSEDILTGVAATLRNFPRVQVRLSAHTDNVGSDESNMQLSQRRARSVAGFLTRNGVDQQRLDVNAYGETRPIADNETASGRVENRRVELDALRVK